MIWPGILLWSLSMLTGPEKFRPGIPGFAEFADVGQQTEGKIPLYASPVSKIEQEMGSAHGLDQGWLASHEIPLDIHF